MLPASPDWMSDPSFQKEVDAYWKRNRLLRERANFMEQMAGSGPDERLPRRRPHLLARLAARSSRAIAAVMWWFAGWRVPSRKARVSLMRRRLNL